MEHIHHNHLIKIIKQKTKKKDWTMWRCYSFCRRGYAHVLRYDFYVLKNTNMKNDNNNNKILHIHRVQHAFCVCVHEHTIPFVLQNIPYWHDPTYQWMSPQCGLWDLCRPQCMYGAHINNIFWCLPINDFLAVCILYRWFFSGGADYQQTYELAILCKHIVYSCRVRIVNVIQ